MHIKYNFIHPTFPTLIKGLLLISLLFALSCDSGSDEPTPELYPLSGIYVFHKAEFTSEPDIPGIPAALLPTDITEPMAEGLLEEAPCDDPENGAVELKSDFNLFFTCIGEQNSEKTGTWEVNADTTQLSLLLAVEIGNLELDIEDLEIDETNDIISGNINDFPLTPDLIEGFFPPGTPVEYIESILAGLPAAVPIDMYIEFKKVADSE